MTNDNVELSCKELVELITEYLEGVLPEEERARFDAHLEICAGCRTYLSQMRQIIDWTGSLREEQVPEQTMQELLGVFHDWKQKGS